jgi:CRP-like cAMP-binding protein
MTPAVEQIRRTVEDRIRELRPVIDELERLQGILTLLEDKEPAVAVKEGRVASEDVATLLSHLDLETQPPIRRSRRGTKPGRDGRAPQGANKQLIIETVFADPGVTATEIAERTGLKRTVVSATINRLKRNGELEADGRGVRVPLGRAVSLPN